MNSKVIIFDLDGVLVNTRELHYEAFASAYSKVTGDKTLTWKVHSDLYEGLSTNQKLKKLLSQKKITEAQGELIFKEKQIITKELIQTSIQPRPQLIQLFETLKSLGYTLACASNSVRNTLDLTLESLKIRSYFSLILSNNDIEQPKPSPEIYLKCFKDLQVSADDCLICEDSKHGREAAYSSGANVLEIEDAEDLTFEKIKNFIENKALEKKKRIQLVIPMAGEGSRFRQKGYTSPKPFIDVLGKPMISWVIENMIDSNNEFEIKFIFICRKSHSEEYDMDKLFSSLNIQYDIVLVDKLTEGAACTVLLAKEKLDLNDPLVIVNSDQYLEWNPNVFYRTLMNPTYDGVISTFYSPDQSDTKWSFAEINADLNVIRVAEKVWIGPNATTGIYGWKRAGDFIHYAEQMIAKNIRVKNEFYVCPVYNECISDNKKIRTFLCKKLWGLGVPEDLEYFISNFTHVAE